MGAQTRPRGPIRTLADVFVNGSNGATHAIAPLSAANTRRWYRDPAFNAGRRARCHAASARTGLTIIIVDHKGRKLFTCSGPMPGYVSGVSAEHARPYEVAA